MPLWNRHRRIAGESDGRDRRRQLPLQFAVLGQRALPTTFFFDANGRLVDTRLGELSPATLAERLEALQVDHD